MWAFMTTGTTHFLKNITESHPNIDFFFMKRGASTLVYYEGNRKKGIFVSGRSFSVLSSYRTIRHTGFIVMDSVPVMEDGMAVFEERVHKALPKMERTVGLYAARFLKQVKSNHYVILTQWKTEEDYLKWQKSDSFKQMDFMNMARLPAYFAERPFTSSYFMLEEEN